MPRCPNGSRRNKKTGKCEKKTKNKKCPDGKMLNPKTNRCIKIKTSVMKKCPIGKILNPKTRVWMMTGTPASQSPMDAFGIAKLICPNRIPKLSGTVNVEFLTRPYSSSRPTGRSFTGEMLIITVTVSEYRYESVITYVKLSTPL